MNAHLQLLFHADHLKFALVRELDDWRQEFGKLREALSFAKTRGARELPFLVIDSGELFSEATITVEPKNRDASIQNAEDLAAFIRKTLGKREHCRVFADALHRFWNLRRSAIKEFAKEHEWEVEIHEPAGYGLVADFRKADKS